MRFRSFDALRLFDVAARLSSFTAAAEELNLTKGAVSYQIRRLEEDLGFALFRRERRGLALTGSGRTLWHVSQSAYRDIEETILRLRDSDGAQITIGTSTYFASRWLSPRLMGFLAAHSRIGLRLQPMIDLVERRAEGIDMVIRWGRGDWDDMEIEPLFSCPAFVTTGRRTAARIEKEGLAEVWPQLVLLHDRDGSTAWRDWHLAAGLPYQPARPGLVVPDPNVRVQAVIDEQGVALNDVLVSAELASGHLAKVSSVELADHGYFLAYRKGALAQPAVRAFRDWICAETAGTA